MIKDDLSMEWYVVGFFDLLGQQNELRSLKSLPDEKNEEENEEFIGVVKKTVGRVIRFKKGFLDYFDSFNSINVLDDPNFNVRFPSVDKNHYRGNNVQLQQFSDCVIAFSSLCDQVNKSPTQGIYAILTAIASTFLGHLAMGVPIRGGIDVGLGAEISENNFYGPGLSRAYTLESKVCQYPRVVIGDELIKYLDLRQAYNGNDPVGKYNKILAQHCRELICIDDDGYPIIDYLSPEMVSILKGSGLGHHLDKAYQFVIDQSNTWKKQKDCKKAFRYTLLRNYFENRLSVDTDK